MWMMENQLIYSSLDFNAALFHNYAIFTLILDTISHPLLSSLRKVNLFWVQWIVILYKPQNSFNPIFVKAYVQVENILRTIYWHIIKIIKHICVCSKEVCTM
jgi:hypothetical protein